MNEHGPGETFDNIEEQTEVLTPGARVVIRSKNIDDHAFQGCSGVLIELPDNSSQLAKIHLDRDPETAHVLVLIDHLELPLEGLINDGSETLTNSELEQPYRPLESAAIGHETWDESRDAGHYNRALTLTYLVDGTECRVTLHAGESDNIDILTNGYEVYVVTTNFGLQYVGLEVFSDGDLVADVFIDNSAVEEFLGEDVWDLNTSEILERLLLGVG